MSLADTTYASPEPVLMAPATLPAWTEVRALIRLAAPVTGLALLNMAISVTDTVMVASLGTDALAAVAVGSDFYSILFYLAVGTIGGLAPLYAAAHAADDTGRLRRLRTAGWLVAALVGLPIGTAIWFGPSALPLIGIDPSLAERGAGYTRAMALTMGAMLAVGMLRTRLTAIERPGALVTITLAAVPLNAVLNYVFMYGALGLSGLGATGAGVASFLVALATLAGLSILAWRQGDTGGARLADLGEVREILRIGIPIGVTTISEVGIFLGATLYAASLSVTDVAAHTIALRMAGVAYAASVGLQQAAMVRTARADAGRRHAVMRAAVWLGAFAGLVVACALFSGAHVLAASFLGGSTGIAVTGTAEILLMLLAVLQLFGPAGAAAGGVLRGLKDARPGMVFSLIGNWAIAAPAGLVLTIAWGYGAIGIWTAIALGSSLSSMLTLLALTRHFPSRFRGWPTSGVEPSRRPG